jgi:hypothetical protein
MFARASRGVPREVNNFIRNATCSPASTVTPELASEVVHDLNGYTDDGLTADMQAMLKFLFASAPRERATARSSTRPASAASPPPSARAGT